MLLKVSISIELEDAADVELDGTVAFEVVFDGGTGVALKLFLKTAAQAEAARSGRRRVRAMVDGNTGMNKEPEKMSGKKELHIDALDAQHMAINR